MQKACTPFLMFSLLHLSFMPAMDAKEELPLPYWNVKGTSILHFLKPIEVDEKPCGLEGVDCIYLINLDRRPDRLARMQNIFESYDLHVQRFSAVDGKQLTTETKQALFGPYPVRMTNGSIGCLLSHLSILHDAYQRKFKCIWVVEDDVDVLEDPHVFVPLLRALQKHDSKWDLFFTDLDAKDSDGKYFFACVSEFRPNQPQQPLAYYQKKRNAGSDFFRIRQRFGAWSLFVSRKGIKKLLDYYQHVYLWSAYDIDLFYTPNLHCYTPRRDIVTQILGQDSDTVAP